MTQINFLSKTALALSSQQEKDKKFFRYAFAVFLASSTVFIFSLAAGFYLQFRLGQVQAQVSLAKNQIDSERELEASYLFFVSKLNIIRELFDQRADKQIAISYFNDLFGPDISISGLTYSMEDGTLSLRVTSPHIFFLEKAFKALDDPEVKKHFASLTKSNLSRNESGEYTFALTVSFTDESELVTVETEYEIEYEKDNFDL